MTANSFVFSAFIMLKEQMFIKKNHSHCKTGHPATLRSRMSCFFVSCATAPLKSDKGLFQCRDHRIPELGAGRAFPGAGDGGDLIGGFDGGG